MSPCQKPAGARATFTARPDFEGWILAPDAAAGSDARSMPDGRRLFILRGIRWVDHPDGSIERSRQVFQEDDVKAAPLPPRLGGGFVFYVTSGSVTLLWRSQTWTGELRPLARVDPPVSEITSGFDRLYLESATTRVWRALDVQSGEPLELLPLPAAAAYGEMAFADPWTAVVLSGVRGPLATFDAGENWYPLRAPGPVNELSLGASGNIVLGTDRGVSSSTLRVSSSRRARAAAKRCSAEPRLSVATPRRSSRRRPKSLLLPCRRSGAVRCAPRCSVVGRTRRLPRS